MYDSIPKFVLNKNIIIGFAIAGSIGFLILVLYLSRPKKNNLKLPPPPPQRNNTPQPKTISHQEDTSNINYLLKNVWLYRIPKQDKPKYQMELPDVSVMKFNNVKGNMCDVLVKNIKSPEYSIFKKCEFNLKDDEWISFMNREIGELLIVNTEFNTIRLPHLENDEPVYLKLTLKSKND